jgi:hypothetical protein
MAWNEYGITNESRFLKIVYNPPSQRLLAHFSRYVSNTHAVESLYLRRITDTLYTKVPGADDLTSYCDPISCRTKPVAFFNVIKHRSEDPQSMDWASISRLELETGAVRAIITSQSLRPPIPYRDGWVSRLIEAQDSGSAVTAVVALLEAPGAGRDKVAYHLCDLDLNTGEPRLITPLLSPFL